MGNAWDYMKSRGVRERAQKKFGKGRATQWDFGRSRKGVSEDVVVRNQRFAELIEMGFSMVPESTEQGRLAKQLGLALHDDTGVWVPVWFSALFLTTPGNKSYLGVATREFSEEVDRHRDDERAKLLVVSEYLLIHPDHQGSDLYTAALAIVRSHQKR